MIYFIKNFTSVCVWVFIHVYICSCAHSCDGSQKWMFGGFPLLFFILIFETRSFIHPGACLLDWSGCPAHPWDLSVSTPSRAGADGTHDHTQLLHGYWVSKFRSSWLQSKRVPADPLFSSLSSHWLDPWWETDCYWENSWYHINFLKEAQIPTK